MKEERERKDATLSPGYVEINDVSSTKDACLKRSTLFLALPPFRLCYAGYAHAGAAFDVADGCSSARFAHGARARTA